MQGTKLEHRAESISNLKRSSRNALLVKAAAYSGQPAGVSGSIAEIS